MQHYQRLCLHVPGIRAVQLTFLMSQCTSIAQKNLRTSRWVVDMHPLCNLCCTVASKYTRWKLLYITIISTHHTVNFTYVQGSMYSFFWIYILKLILTPGTSALPIFNFLGYVQIFTCFEVMSLSPLNLNITYSSLFYLFVCFSACWCSMSCQGWVIVAKNGWQGKVVTYKLLCLSHTHTHTQYTHMHTHKIHTHAHTHTHVCTHANTCGRRERENQNATWYPKTKWLLLFLDAELYTV